MMHPVTPPVLTVNDIRREARRCFDAGECLMLAIEEQNRDHHIATASANIVRVGNALGYVFSRESKIRGELVNQRIELEIAGSFPKYASDVACRAAEADMWRNRALAAEAELLALRSRRTAA